jgi:epoxyqueuosine reductase
MSLSQEIRDYALDIGFDRVGITTADDFPEHDRELQDRGEAYAFFTKGALQLQKSARPRQAMPEARAIVSLAWDYAKQAFPEALLGRVGRLYQARCYHAGPQRLHGARTRLMADFLREKGCTVASGMILLPDRPAAVRSGTAFIGRNTFAYAGGIGSFIVLTSFLVDRELDWDAPHGDVPCPEGCTRCMDACPTRALQAPYRLDPRRCLAFNAWCTQEGREPFVTGSIPREVRAAMGTRVHGCDLCQEACPRNAAKVKGAFPPDPFLESLAGRFSLAGMLEMSDRFNAEVVQPIMYNYIKDKKYFQRNAAVALGNTGDPAHVPALGRALEDPEPVVRGHAAWALGRIGGHPARARLESALGREDDAGVRREIAEALA